MANTVLVMVHRNANSHNSHNANHNVNHSVSLTVNRATGMCSKQELSLTC
jgi:hypothetical protein